MQRWMAAKVQIAKRHGTMRSGCNRATGDVWDDVRSKRGKYDEDDRGFAPITSPRDTERHGQAVVSVSPKLRKVQGTVVVLKTERPVAWGQGRKARRAANLER